MHSINRRDFMATGAMAAAGALGNTVLGSGMGAPALAASPVRDPSHKRVLVAYDTGCGSTAGVAKAISKALENATTSVDLRLVSEADHPGNYDAVVVGSAVRRSRWLPDALDFVGDHKQVLRDIPTAYFLTCVTLYHDTDQARDKASSYLEPTFQAAPAVKPVGVGLFAGALDYAKVNMLMQIIMKSKMEKRGIPEGDFRDFPAIKAWASGLAPQLGVAPAQMI